MSDARRQSTKHVPPTSEVVRGKFTILRAVDANSVIAGKPLEFLPPKAVHFPNAKGGLRLVNSSEIRDLAGDSALRIINALAKREV